MPVQIPRRSPWANQRLVLWALLHREAVTRFGQYKLGVVWLITEPLISVLVMGLLLGPLVGRTAPDMPYAFFLLNGFMHLLAFSGPLNSGIGAISSNHGLLVFPKVQPFDLLLARFLFDLMSSVLSFTAFCIVGMWMGVNLSLGYLHTLLATFILSWMMGSGIGMMLAVGAAYFNSVDKVMAFTRRPLIFVSCVLYPLHGLPNKAQEFLLWNPLVHTIEISRKSLFPLYHIGAVTLVYPTIAAIVLFSIGTCLFHNHRHYLTQK